MTDTPTTRVYALVAVLANLAILDVFLFLELLGYHVGQFSTPLDLAALTLSLIATILAAVALGSALDTD